MENENMNQQVKPKRTKTIVIIGCVLIVIGLGIGLFIYRFKETTEKVDPVVENARRNSMKSRTLKAFNGQDLQSLVWRREKYKGKKTKNRASTCLYVSLFSFWRFLCLKTNSRQKW